MIPEIKKIIRSLTYAEAQEIARHVLTLRTGHEVVHYLQHRYQLIMKNVVSRR